MEIKEDRRLDCMLKDCETSFSFFRIISFMKIYRPSDTCFDEMKSRMNRRALPEDSVRDTVNAIIQDVSARGDEALFDYAAVFVLLVYFKFSTCVACSAKFECNNFFTCYCKAFVCVLTIFIFISSVI